VRSLSYTGSTVLDFFGGSGITTRVAIIDFERRRGYIEKELTRKGVTRQRLWKEYSKTCKKEGRDYYSYTCFCELLREWRKKNRPPVDEADTQGR